MYINILWARYEFTHHRNSKLVVVTLVSRCVRCSTCIEQTSLYTTHVKRQPRSTALVGDCGDHASAGIIYELKAATPHTYKVNVSSVTGVGNKGKRD